MGILSNIGNFVQNRRRENEEVEMGRAIRKTEQEKLTRARLQERLSVHKAHASALRERIGAEKEIKALKQEERNLKYAKVNEGISKVKTFLKEHRVKPIKGKKPKGSIFSSGSKAQPNNIFSLAHETHPQGMMKITSPFVHQERKPIVHHKKQERAIHIHISK